MIDTQAAQNVDRLACFAARLTQKPLSGDSQEELVKLFYKPIKDKTIETLIKSEHRNAFSLNMIPVVIIGASRRFLAQITRHQVGISFMSTSLQYCMWEGPTFYGDDDPVIKEAYNVQMEVYKEALKSMNSDMAGYFAPEGLQGTLIISATPWEWRHIIQLRTCKRNTPETIEIIEMVKEVLAPYSKVFDTGPGCTEGGCKEVINCSQKGKSQLQFASTGKSKK